MYGQYHSKRYAHATTFMHYKETKAASCHYPMRNIINQSGVFIVYNANQWVDTNL